MTPSAIVTLLRSSRAKPSPSPSLEEQPEHNRAERQLERDLTESGKSDLVGVQEQVRGEFLTDLCKKLAHYPKLEIQNTTVVGPVYLVEAKLGQLMLLNCRVDAISLERCDIEGLYLRGSYIDQISTANSFIAKLDAQRLTACDVRLNKNFIAQQVDLRDAQVDGVLDLDQARLIGPAEDDIVLLADGLVVHRDALFRYGFTAWGQVSLKRASIASQLSFTGAIICNPGKIAIAANGITVTGEVYLNDGFRSKGRVDLVNANISQNLNCSGGVFIGNHNCAEDSFDIALNVDHAFVGHSVYLNSDTDYKSGSNFLAVGPVQLCGMRIEQRLYCTDGVFFSPGQVALCCDGIDIKGDVHLNRKFRVYGSLHFIGAMVEGDFICTDGTFTHPASPTDIDSDGDKESLVADHAVISGNVYLNAKLNRELLAEGTIRFVTAEIKHDFDCRKAHLRNKTVSLKAEAVNVEGDVHFEELTADGKVLLNRACIKRDLQCEDALFNGSEIAFDLRGGEVQGTFEWALKEAPAGAVDLQHAHVGKLSDKHESWFRKELHHRSHSLGYFLVQRKNGSRTDPELRLVGFRYDALKRYNDESQGTAEKINQRWWSNFLSCLKNDYKKEPRERVQWVRQAAFYSPQPYKQLAHIFHERGEGAASRWIMIQQENERFRSLPGLHLGRRLWGWFFKYTVRYGYHPELLLLWFAILLSIGALVADRAAAERAIVAAKPNGLQVAATDCRKDQNYPCFRPWIYSTEVLLPVVKLEQREYWTVNQAAPHGIGYAIATWSGSLAGWALATAFVAGVANVWKRS